MRNLLKGLIVILFGLLSIGVYALEFKHDGMFYYYAEDGSYEVTLKKGANIAEVIIPESVSFRNIEYTVTKISNNAFSYCGDIESVTIPATIYEIEDGHHYEDVHIMSSVMEGAFNNCSSLQTVVINSEKIKSLGNFTFSGCSSLKNINLPTSINIISTGLFYNCFSLESIILPENISAINGLYYQSCFSADVYILGAFSNTSINEINLPSNIINIGDCAFSGCSSLKNIDIPKNINIVSDYLFYNCTSLQAVNLPDNIQSIGIGAFANCNSLKSIFLPESLTRINGGSSPGFDTVMGGVEGAFSSCTSLSSITLPSSLKYLDNYVFYNCSSLKEINLKSKEPFTIYENSFPNDNEIIYIPKGSKENYEIAPIWVYMENLVERDFDDNKNKYHSVVISKNKGGSVLINEDYSMSVIKENEKAVIQIIPDNNYNVKSVLLNGNDITSDLVDNKYIIEEVSDDIKLNVIFEFVPIYLTIKQSNFGVLKLKVNPNETFEFYIMPEEGYSVNTITYNGVNISNEIDDDCRYITPVITHDSELRISFSETILTDIIEENLYDIRVYSSDDNIIINNIRKDDDISVYTTTGALITSLKSTGETANIIVPVNNIYIVKVNKKTFKLAL